MLYLIPIIGILSWLYIFSRLRGGSPIPWSIRGGGDDDEPAEPATPAPAPSPAETSEQAIQAQIDAVPKLLATQQQYGPQFTQLELENLERFGPQYAQAGLDLSRQFGEQYAEQAIKEQNILDPSRAAGSQALTSYLQAGAGSLTPEDEEFIQESARDAAASRGLLYSGMSAQDEVSRMFGARQALKDRYYNIALAAAGRLPSTQTGATVSSGNTSAGQLVQNIDPATFFGGQANANNYAANIYGTQGSIYNSKMSNQDPSMAGMIVGGLASGFGSAVGTGVGFKLAGG